MLQIQEEFKILEMENTEERANNNKIKDFILAMVEWRKQASELKKTLREYDDFKNEEFLLWGIWNEIIILEKIIMKTQEKTFIPNTEMVKKEM